MRQAGKHHHSMRDADLKDYSSFLKELQGESDRGAALVGAALIDDQLDRLLRAHLIEGKVADSLLDGGNAPLGTFSTRLKLAYSLGLLSKLEYDEGDLIRRIRNEFAHGLHGLTFQKDKVKDLCLNLRADTPDGARYGNDPRKLYINSVVLMTLSLLYRHEYAAMNRCQTRRWSYELAEDRPRKGR